MITLKICYLLECYLSLCYDIVSCRIRSNSILCCLALYNIILSYVLSSHLPLSLYLMSYLSTCISYLLSSHLQFSFPSLISYLSTSYYHHLVLSLIFPPDINGQSLPHGDIHSSYCCLKHMVNLYCFETQQDFDVIFWNTTIWGCFVLKHNKMMVE